MWRPSTQNIGPRRRRGGGQRERRVARMLRLPGFIWLVMKGSKCVRVSEKRINREIKPGMEGAGKGVGQRVIKPCKSAGLHVNVTGRHCAPL